MAAQRSHVPKFGNWDSGENVPYTAYFDKARKGRTGARIINPNDPEENADLSLENPSSDNLPPPSRPRANSEDQTRKGSLHSEDDPKHFVDSPARHDNASSRSGSRSHGGVGAAADNRRRQSTGSEYSIERSPLHRQAKAPGRDSPQWEPKNSYDSSQGTPGRSRLRPANRGDETPDKGAAVPKFGDWDVNNPASADGFTHIFNKVREERQSGPGQVPGTPNERPQAIRGPASDDKVQCCCFAWGGKK